MDLFYTLVLNILGVGILGLIVYWLTQYCFAWWLRVQRTDFITKEFYGKWVFLEIKIPKEIHKSPAAMEIVLNSLYQMSGHNPESVFRKRPDDGHGKKKKKHLWQNDMRDKFWDKYIKGKVRLWSSLEIVSDEGQIRFYVVTIAKFAEIFKNFTYAQYPGIEITETEDYTMRWDYHTGGDTSIFHARFKLGKDDILPIKTYIDYGLDEDPKEEYKIDPLTSLLETFATAGEGENFWMQILIRPTTDKEWLEKTKKRIDEILGIERDKDTKKITKEGRSALSLVPHEKLELEILQRNIEKNGFDTIVRTMYLAKKGKFNANRGVLGVINCMKSFEKPGYNSFAFVPFDVFADYPYRDPKGLQSEFMRGAIFHLYKMRIGFYYEAEGGRLEWRKFFYKMFTAKNPTWGWDHIEKMKEYLHAGVDLHKGEMYDFVLNTEELATIYHFPGKAFGNTSARVSSIKSDPPMNLPI